MQPPANEPDLSKQKVIVQSWLIRNWAIPLAVALWVIASVWAYWVINPQGQTHRIEWLKTSAQGGAALFVAMGLVYTHRTLEHQRNALSEQLKSQQEARDQQRRSEQNERFFRAAELLSKPDSVDAQIAAMYALEQLAHESDDYYQLAIEVICSYARRRSKDTVPPVFDETKDFSEDNLMPTTSFDLEVAAYILARRTSRRGSLDGMSLDLRGVNFNGLKIMDADFSHARLDQAWLIGTEFIGCDVQMVSFANADMRRPSFQSSVLASSMFDGANLRYAVIDIGQEYLAWHPVVLSGYICGTNQWLVQQFEKSEWVFPMLGTQMGLPQTASGTYLRFTTWVQADVEHTSFLGMDLRGLSQMTREQWDLTIGYEDSLKPGLIARERGLSTTFDPTPEGYKPWLPGEMD